MNGPLDSTFDAQLQSELDRGERITWQTQARNSSFGGRTALPIVLSVVWSVAIVIPVLSIGHTAHSHGSAPFSSLSFLIVPLIVMAVPLLRLLNTGKTFYLITSQRALIITLGRTKRVISYYPEKLRSLERREKPDGSGDIIFERTMVNPFAGNYRSGNALQEIGFLNIPDVKNVESLLRTLAAKPSGPAS